MPKVPPEHLEARRSGILRAAHRCFSRRGTHVTTMKDICRAANLSPGAVYRYFRSKAEIVAALAEQSRERTRRFFDAAPAGRGAPETLSGKVEALCRALERGEGLDEVRLDIALWGEALHQPALGRVFRRGASGLRAALGAVVREGQERGEVDPDLDPEAVAAVLLALFDGLALQKALDPELDLEPAVAAAAALFQAGVRGPS